jgi:hypothetical protein
LKFFFADDKYNCRQQKLFELRIDGCRFKPQSLGMVAKMMYESMIKSINFDLKCPYKAGIYNVTNYKSNLKINLPLPDFGKYCLKAEFYGKPKGQKGFEKLISYGGAGSLAQK